MQIFALDIKTLKIKNRFINKNFLKKKKTKCRNKKSLKLIIQFDYFINIRLYVEHFQ